MQAQGYKPKMILAKDNISEIRMLKNGKSSCTSNSKHVAIKYFWSTDRIKNGNIEVEHCPTDRMLADYMSKPLQGSLFNSFRDVIMGWKHISTLYDYRLPIEERVENHDKNVGFSTIGDISHNKSKMTYAQAAKCRLNVQIQNQRIGSGLHPTDTQQ